MILNTNTRGLLGERPSRWINYSPMLRIHVHFRENISNTGKLAHIRRNVLRLRYCVVRRNDISILLPAGNERQNLAGDRGIFQRCKKRSEVADFFDRKEIHQYYRGGKSTSQNHTPLNATLIFSFFVNMYSFSHCDMIKFLIGLLVLLVNCAI